MLTPNFPVRCKRFFSTNSSNDDTVFKSQRADNNKNALLYPPDYVSITVPSGICSASELAVNERQRESMPQLGFDSEHTGYHTAKYGRNSWWSDGGLLNRIEDEFARIHPRNGLKDGFMVEMAQSAKDEKRVQAMAQSGNAVMDRTVQALLQENHKLKGEVNQWKKLNQDLYKFTCNKMSGKDTTSGMSLFSRTH